MAIAGIGGTGLVCSKSHLSKIVDRDEMGKVMSFLSTLETISPMIFTTVFTYIFKYTIDTYPGDSLSRDRGFAYNTHYKRDVDRPLH